jgi:hypothetical protein
MLKREQCYTVKGVIFFCVARNRHISDLPIMAEVIQNIFDTSAVHSPHFRPNAPPNRLHFSLSFGHNIQQKNL